MPEEFCEQCGQPLVPNARFCTACGWETGSQATLPLPQGVTGGYGNSGYQAQDYPQQGDPTPLEEFEQEFENQATYEPAYDPYSQYGTADGYDDGSNGGQGNDNNSGNSKGKRKSKGTKSKTNKKSTGTGAAKNAAKSKASAGKAYNKANSARKHPATTAAIVILVCIVVVFSGIGIVRMMTSDHGTGSGSGSGSSSSAATSGTASGNTHAGSGTASQGNQHSKQSGKSSTTDTKSKKNKTQQQDSQPSAGGVYANARFGYAVTIPAGFTWNPEATNGDGRTFTNSQTGMTIAAWGSNNGSNETPESAFAQTTAGHQVAYQQITDTEFTASWEENGTITYVREMVSAGAISAIRFDYPSAQRNDCDRIVEQVVPTLTVSDAASGASEQ